jgi:hypothetical protein
MMVEISDRFFPANERCISHEFSDRGIISAHREIEPFDYIGSIPEYFAEQKNRLQTHIEN